MLLICLSKTVGNSDIAWWAVRGATEVGLGERVTSCTVGDEMGFG